MSEPSPLHARSRADGRLSRLVIGHYATVLLFAALSCYPIYRSLTLNWEETMRKIEDAMASGDQAGTVFGLLDLSVPLTLAILGVLHTGLTALSGWCVQTRRWRGYSVAVAILNCFAFPFGTPIGVWALIVLNQRDVRELYPKKKR